MSKRARVESMLQEMRKHLYEELLPFWLTHGQDTEYGGFLTYLDENGNPTGESDKTAVCQTRMIYTYSSARRQGYGDPQFEAFARQGVNFFIDKFWDAKNGGWYWIVQQDGTPRDPAKLMYGHSFAIYALSEFAMLTGDKRALEYAIKTWECLRIRAADIQYGGFGEFFEEDWQPKAPGVYGGDRKSFDVHMHLMEAFTNLYEATKHPQHRADTIAVINLIFERIINKEYGTGMAQFAFDWTPLRAILFKNVWGSDRDVEEKEGRPLNNTSFGHNVEFGWLLQHSINILGLNLDDYKDKLRPLYDHCCAYGIDRKNGGVFCEGPNDGPARERNKEFWQQAEVLVGMLDAALLFGDDKYLDAYENVHRFVMDVNINHEVGEWYPLFDEHNNRLWSYMGHAWKINYHTIRACIQSEKRLTRLLEKLS